MPTTLDIKPSCISLKVFGTNQPVFDVVQKLKKDKSIVLGKNIYVDMLKTKSNVDVTNIHFLFEEIYGVATAAIVILPDSKLIQLKEKNVPSIYNNNAAYFCCNKKTGVTTYNRWKH